MEVNASLAIVVEVEEAKWVLDEDGDGGEGPFRISVVTSANEVMGMIDLVVLISLSSLADCNNEAVEVVGTGPSSVVSTINVNEVTGMMVVGGVVTLLSTANIAIGMALILFVSLRSYGDE